MARSRSVARVVTAHRQTEGGGFVVRRPFPGRELDGADPFLLLDEMGPVTYAPGEALGARAVIETVTPILYHDWTIAPGARAETAVPEDFDAFVYVFSGEARVGADGRAIGDGQMALLGSGDACPVLICRAARADGRPRR